MEAAESGFRPLHESPWDGLHLTLFQHSLISPGHQAQWGRGVLCTPELAPPPHHPPFLGTEHSGYPGIIHMPSV